MVNNSSFSLAQTCASIVIALNLSLPAQPVYAAEYVPYKLHMKRKNPEKPIRKSAIMAKVRKKWPGRVLHIAPDTSGGQDCHIVKAIGDDGEFRIIRVACNN